MKIHFYLRYATKFGESFSLCIAKGQRHTLEYLSDDFCALSLELNPAHYPEGLSYSYEFHTIDGLTKPEADPQRHIALADLKLDSLDVYDYFNPLGLLGNVFTTQPFRALEARSEVVSPDKKGNFTHIFRVKAPLLKADEQICLLGHGNALRNWDRTAPILLKKTSDWWEIRLDLSSEEFPLSYKYGVWNARINKFLGFEDGGNRPIYTGQPSTVHRPPSTVHRAPSAVDRAPSTVHRLPSTIFHDNFARLPLPAWKGAGVAIPVFSLRSKKSWGVGEFTDLHLLVDWAKSVGLKLIQLLPINDTTATHTWVDSYPYSAISAFALHPIYLNVEQLAGKKQADILKPFLKKQKELNALDAVDYEAVLQTKWEIIRQLYALQKADWMKDADYLAYYESNKHWLAPYAAFCWLRDANATADFSQWSKYSTFKQAEIDKLLEPKGKHFDEIGLHLFVQWHLHLQLKAAADYAHSNGLSVKGDIPIGIYRYSCDAWVAPDLYEMNAQAGAPPDDFAENGQNWGFPTYNWAKMKADGFSWWKQRFEQMSLYFDAFRIDHILGFFRIWSIPLDAVQGILGQFDPAIPVTEDEFRQAGIGFNFDRFCRPFITDAVLQDVFGADAAQVVEQFLTLRTDGLYELRAEFNTQRKVEDWLQEQKPNDFLRQVRDGLFHLISNVILLESPKGGYAFRFGMEKTSSFQYLPEGIKGSIKALYVNYFYRRQDDFWQREAMEKLPALKAATQMLICGEDLGMVPACVPDVMHELGILSLEIQRMPKAAGATFFHPKDAPYLSVVTPSTHDMSTLRGWWEEDHALTQRFYNEILQRSGEAPFFCEAWVNMILLEQHFHSPAMWAIFQLQDLLGMDASLRRQNPNDERINVPANPKHYWRYRVHLTLEELMKAESFNGAIRRMVGESGRG